MIRTRDIELKYDTKRKFSHFIKSKVGQQIILEDEDAWTISCCKTGYKMKTEYIPQFETFLKKDIDDNFKQQIKFIPDNSYALLVYYEDNELMFYIRRIKHFGNDLKTRKIIGEKKYLLLETN